MVRRSRFAVGRFLGFAVFLQRTVPESFRIPAVPLGELGLRLELSSTKPSRPCRSAANSSHGLRFPSALEDSEIHSLRVLPARYGPPAGFGYPLDGLRPPNPCRFYFTPAALLGFSLRSFPLSQGCRNVSESVAPTYRFTRRCFRCPKASDRPDGFRFLGFDPCESPSRPNMGLARRPPVAPLGFTLLGLASDSLAWVFARAPLTRLACLVANHFARPAPQSFDQLSLGHSSSRQRVTGSSRDNPSRVFAPVRSRSIRAKPLPGYGFTSRRVAHCCRLFGGLWSCPRSAEAGRDRLRC